MPRRTPSQPRRRCEPQGSLAPHPLDGPEACACRRARVCRWCGLALTARPTREGTEWSYVDSTGGSYGDPPPLEAKMKDKKLPPGVKDAYDLLDYYERTDDILSYSMLQIDLASGALRPHRHDAAGTSCTSSEHPVAPGAATNRCTSPLGAGSAARRRPGFRSLTDRCLRAGQPPGRACSAGSSTGSPKPGRASNSSAPTQTPACVLRRIPPRRIRPRPRA